MRNRGLEKGYLASSSNSNAARLALVDPGNGICSRCALISLKLLFAIRVFLKTCYLSFTSLGSIWTQSRNDLRYFCITCLIALQSRGDKKRSNADLISTQTKVPLGPKLQLPEAQVQVLAVCSAFYLPPLRFCGTSKGLFECSGCAPKLGTGRCSANSCTVPQQGSTSGKKTPGSVLSRTVFHSCC